MIDKAIEAQLEERTPEELAGAYRALCGMMLVHSALAFRRRALCRNEDAYQKNEAKRWMVNGRGVLSFAECCAALDMNVAKAQRAIREFAPRHAVRSISRAETGE